MKAVHAADIHLDTPLRGLARYEDAPADELRSATRRAFDNLIEAVIEEQVDLLLLAGDVFDGDWPHYSSGAHFVRQMQRLDEASVRVASVTGNHDAKSKVTKSLRLPDNVRVLSTRRPESWPIEDLGVVVHGQSYAEPAVTTDLCLAYPAPVADAINIGLLHTSADGRPGHERYAPCTVETLVNRGYHYFGLGHVHTREVLSDDPAVVFCGALQGRGLRETGPKGATFIDFEDGSVVHTHRALDVVRWEVISVDASGCKDRDDVCGRVSVAVRESVAAVEGRLIAARVAITGATDAHAQLHASPERLRHEVALAAAEAAGDQVWIEGTAIETTSPAGRLLAGDDAVGELVAELDELASDDNAISELGKLLEPLTGALPVGVLEDFNPTDPDVLRALVAEVRTGLPLALVEGID